MARPRSSWLPGAAAGALRLRARRHAHAVPRSAGTRSATRHLLRVGVRLRWCATTRPRRRGGDRGEHQQPLLPAVGEHASSTSRSARCARPRPDGRWCRPSISGISAVIDPDGAVHERDRAVRVARSSARRCRRRRARRSTCASATGWCCSRAGHAWCTVLAIRRPVPTRPQVASSLTAATSPTTTIRPAQRGRGEPPTDGRAELRADHRADRDEQHHQPGHVGEEHEQDRRRRRWRRARARSSPR